MKNLTLGKSDNFFADSLIFSCASLIHYELDRMVDPKRGAQGGSCEVWVALTKYFSESRNKLISLGMAKFADFFDKFFQGQFSFDFFVYSKLCENLKTALALALGDTGYPESIWVSVMVHGGPVYSNIWLCLGYP